jgi:hypothetical protein
VRGMGPVLAALALSLLQAEPNNTPPTEKLDVSARKAQLRAFSDGKKHVVIIEMSKEKTVPDWVFYGDGKSMYRLYTHGGGGETGVSFEVALWEPRTPTANAFVEYRNGKLHVGCADRKTELPQLSAEDTKKTVDAADFYSYRWTRKPYLLARDDKGTYYFVDMQRDVPGKKDMRLYIGPRGKLKLQQMTNIVSDSMGDIFSTRSGELRLVANTDSLKWVQGKEESKLTNVPPDENHVMIYTELGVYERLPLGTPCDDF